jgi:hypothetical protein
VCAARVAHEVGTMTEYPVREASHWLVDDARAAWAVDSRASRRSLEATAAADATLVGALRDVAERRGDVQIETVSGRRQRGALHGVAIDHVTMRDDSGVWVLVTRRSIVCVRPGGEHGRRPATGARGPAQDRTLAEQLDRIADGAEPVRVGLRAGPVLVGRLLAVGDDLVSLRLEADGRVAYVPLAAIEIVTSGVTP